MTRRLKGGELLAVPVGNGLWATGLVARVGRRGVLFGYFFGPATSEFPSIESAGQPQAGDAILIGMFGHLGIQEGLWQVLGRLKSWNPGEWPLERFVHEDSLTGQHFIVEYSDDLSTEVRRYPADGSDTTGLPEDGLMGEGFVRLRLAKLLDPRVG